MSLALSRLETAGGGWGGGASATHFATSAHPKSLAPFFMGTPLASLGVAALPYNPLMSALTTHADSRLAH